MSDRESLEKRCIYKNPEDNAIYIMSSSIPDELFPPKKEVVRITNYCNYYKLIDEGDYIGFYSLNQTDFKMSIPQFLINVTLPTTTKNWTVQRRYSDFNTLRKLLIKFYPGFNVPPLPK